MKTRPSHDIFTSHDVHTSHSSHSTVATADIGTATGLGISSGLGSTLFLGALADSDSREPSGRRSMDCLSRQQLDLFLSV